MRLWTESEAWNAAEIYCGLILAALIAWCLAISATLGKETGQRMQPDCGDKINSAQTSNGTLTILAGKCTKYEPHFGEIPLLKNKDIFSFQIWASILCGLSRVHIVWWTCRSFIKKFRNGLTERVCVVPKMLPRIWNIIFFLPFIRSGASSWRLTIVKMVGRPQKMPPGSSC